MPETLAMRAARYFGVQDKPRTGIKVGRSGYLMVTEFSGRTTLMHYDEEYRPTGDHIKLTDRQREALIDALSPNGQYERQYEADAAKERQRP